MWRTEWEEGNKVKGMRRKLEEVAEEERRCERKLGTKKEMWRRKFRKNEKKMRRTWEEVNAKVLKRREW